MTTAADKLLVTAIETGELSKNLFKTPHCYKATNDLAMLANKQEYAKLKQMYEGDTISVLGQMCEKTKISVLRKLSDGKMLEEQPAFWGILPHIFRPNATPISGVKFLEQDKDLVFKVDIPADTLSTFAGYQYFDIEFYPPQLSNSPANDDYRGFEKYSYTDKPGIRLFPTIKFTSNGNDVQCYDYLDVLRIDKENIKDSCFEQWNKAIGHDLYKTAGVYNQSTEVTYGVLTKNGYQTPKHSQSGLRMRVPLFFNHNRCFADKLNLNSFLEGSLTIEGTIAASSKMVKAEFYPDDVTEPVVQLECKPLTVKRFTLVSEKFFVNDQYHALMSNKQISKFVRYFGNKVGYIKNDDPEEMIPLNGKGYVESVTLALRPASYENDFSKWQQLSEVSHQCSPTAIVVKDVNGDFKKLVVKPASIEEAVASLEAIGMNANGFNIKPVMDPEYYANIESLRVAGSSCDYRPRDNVLYKFHFNHHYHDKMLSGMLVQTKLEDLEIQYKFKDEYIASNGLLKQKWQYIIYRDLCNQQFGVGSSMTTLYQL